MKYSVYNRNLYNALYSKIIIQLNFVNKILLYKSKDFSPACINEIVREERGITADMTLLLAKYSGGDAMFWLN